MRPPCLHVVTTDEVAQSPEVGRVAEAMLGAAGERLALHLRLRRADALSLYRLAGRLAEVARRTGGWCVVNGRLDVALAAGAQAAQLGAGSLPLAAARKVAGRRLFLGASVHSPEEAAGAAGSGADYLLAGTVFETATHPNRPPAGTDVVTECARAGLPVIGIGGIDLDNAPRVMAAGAAGIAVVRAVWSAPDPVEEALRLIEQIQGERE